MFGERKTTVLMVQVFVVVLLAYVGVGEYYLRSHSAGSRTGGDSALPGVESVNLRPASLTQVVLPTQEVSPTPSSTPTRVLAATSSPAPSTPTQQPTPPPADTEPPELPAGASQYTVQTGDSLDSIARAHGLTVEELLGANPVLRERPDDLAVGQVLVIPARPGGEPAPTPTPAPWVYYTVQEGDTLEAIAQQFGVTSDSIASFNALEDPDDLQPGQTLTIPVQ